MHRLSSVTTPLSWSKTGLLWPLAKLTSDETQSAADVAAGVSYPSRADGNTPNMHQPPQPLVESNLHDHQTKKGVQRQRAPCCAGAQTSRVSQGANNQHLSSVSLHIQKRRLGGSDISENLLSLVVFG